MVDYYTSLPSSGNQLNSIQTHGVKAAAAAAEIGQMPSNQPMREAGRGTIMSHSTMQKAEDGKNLGV